MSDTVMTITQVTTNRRLIADQREHLMRQALTHQHSHNLISTVYEAQAYRAKWTGSYKGDRVATGAKTYNHLSKESGSVFTSVSETVSWTDRPNK